MLRRGLVLILLTVVVVAAGAAAGVYFWTQRGSPSVQSEARGMLGDSSIKCTKVGVMAVVGTSANVFDCRSAVAGSAYHCIVRVKGGGCPARRGFSAAVPVW